MSEAVSQTVCPPRSNWKPDLLVVPLRRVAEPALLRRLPPGYGVRTDSLDPGGGRQGRALPMQAERQDAALRRQPPVPGLSRFGSVFQ